MATAPTGPDNVLRVLSELEVLPGDATGALAFGPEATISGVVLLERGRVCWAAAKGLRRRLTDLLRSCCSPALTAEQVEQLFQNCRQHGKPVGEALVDQGLVTPEALRAALLHHTAESLSAGASWTEVPRWVPHRARGYQSAYTFLPVELLSYASSVGRGQAEVREGCERLHQWAGERSAAVFDLTGTTLLGCRLPEDRRTSLRSLRAAGAWAAESLADSGARSTVLKFTRDRQGAIWLGWHDQALTFLVQCRDREDFSALVRSLHVHGWTSAVHSSVPLVEPQVAAT